ncbi:MAG: preprotein translocase subunit SecG [Brevinema sp.]
MIIFLLTIFVISIVLLIPAILLQTNGADNGVLSSNITAGAFGAKSNEILVKFTSWMATVFIASALLLSIHFVKGTASSKSSTAETTETSEPSPSDYNDASN